MNTDNGKSLDESILDSIFKIIKWFGLQAILFFLTPYLWNYEYGVGAIVLILIYTTLYAIYGEYATKEVRLRWSLVPYVVYLIIAILRFYLPAMH